MNPTRCLDLDRWAVRGAGYGTAAAWTTTMTTYAVGNVGAPIRVVAGWAPDGTDLTVAEALITAATSVALGGLALWLMERHDTRGYRRWTVLAATVSVLSALPLWRLQVDTGSKAALSTMHLATGVCAIGAQAFVRRHQRGPGDRSLTTHVQEA